MTLPIRTKFITDLFLHLNKMATPTYKPLVDVAFKKRIATNFNSEVMERMVQKAIRNIPDIALTVGMQRMAMSNHLLNQLEIDPTIYAGIIVVDVHGKHVKLTHESVKQESLGTYNDVEYFGLKLAGSNFGYTGTKLIGVYDAILRDEGRSIDAREVESTQEVSEDKPQTKPKKAKK